MQPGLAPTPKPPYNPDLAECYEFGSTLAIRASTWSYNPTAPKDSFSDAIRKNPRKALNEFGSVKPQAIEAFCRDSSLVDRRANLTRESPLNEDGSFKDWFVPGPYEYFFHGDLGETRDAAGFSLAHCDVDRKKVVIDLMLQCEPPPGGSLQYERFKQLVLSLRKRGFQFKKISFDNWQSRSTRQALTNRGLEAVWHSVDKDTASYDTLLELLLMDALDFYPHPVFSWEFQNVLYINGKVDHKVDGSKDLCDAIAAVCFHAVESNELGDFRTTSMQVPLNRPEVEVQSFRQVGGKLVEIVPQPARKPGGDDDEDDGVAFPTLSVSF